MPLPFLLGLFFGLGVVFGPALADDSIRKGPQIVRPSVLGVGRLVPDLEFTDIHGKSGRLSQLADKKAIVLAMTGTGCPLCKKYSPTLAAIEKRYAEKSVAFIFLNPNESETLETLKTEVRDKGFRGHYIRDDEEQISKTLDVKTTTEVFVLDKARTLVYRGAVDDQYGFGYAMDAPRKNYLVDALTAVLSGTKPQIAATSSPGCEMFYQSDVEVKVSTVTYHNRISRIVQNNCLECHRDGGVAPMGLSTYQEVADYAGMIGSVVDRGVMPPWFAAPMQNDRESEPTKESAHSIWANDRSLSAADKADLLSWVKAGAPEGDESDAPLPISFPKGWLIGQPDAVFQFPKPIPVKATGVLPYKNIVIETNLDEDKWVNAIEIIPGDRSVVHHVLVFVLPADGRGRGGGVDYWGVYVPGNSTQIYPDGFARRLPKGSRLKFQMHYTTNGKATEDQTKIGLVFAKKPPKYEVKTSSIANGRFRIPPGADHHRVDASIRVPADVQVLGYLPHHHLRGKACKYELVTQSGETQTLLDIPRYDFNWQLFYQYNQPKTIREGSRVNFIAWYDNSENNPANPDPSQTVRWGDQTFDEMHLGYVEYVVLANDDQQGGDSSDDSNPKKGRLFRRLDVNGDGVITRQEVRQRLPSRIDGALRIFDRLDKDGNGKLDQREGEPLDQIK